MMTAEKLSEYAARRLCPNDIDKGRLRIKAAVNKIFWRGMLLAILDYVALLGGLFLIARAILKVYYTQHLPGLPLEWILAIAGALLVIWPISGKREIQNRTKFFTAGRRYAGHLPEPLESLLIELSLGSIHTSRELKAGEKDGGAIHASTGEVLNSGLSRENYLNRYAVLLLSPNTKDYEFVWPRVSFSHTISSTIYVTHEESEAELATAKINEVATRLERTADINAAAAGQFIDGSKQFTVDVKRIHTAALAFMRAWDIADAQENKNSARMDYWLVGDTDEVFAVGAEAFIKAEIGHQNNAYLENAYRIVLWEGRRQLQKGGLQGDLKSAVRHIQLKLERMQMSPTKGRDDFKTVFSDSTITKLLRGYRSGTHGDRDITGYFSRDRQLGPTIKTTT